jgi:hypothetical protein
VAETSPDTAPRAHGWTLIAAGLLLAALALVVLYTSQRAFLSPVALVVVAAIGVAALLLQLRLRPGLAAPEGWVWGPLFLNIFGVVLALAAVFADVLHFSPTVMLIVALGSVVAFAAGGILVLNNLRKGRR